MENTIQLYKGDIFYFTTSPLSEEKAWEYYPKGALAVKDGKIVAVGEWDALLEIYPEHSLIDYSGKLIMPGFIDSHIHYPQTGMIGMYGKQLLDWLETYTFPVEETFMDESHAKNTARQFVNELFRNGTTTCMAYATVHPHSVSSLFSVASEFEMCMLTGKVLMNRNAPENLLDTTQQGEAASHSLIEEWHKKGRNYYVLTPRFAITSTFDQLESTGKLHAAYPDTYIQTHLSENIHEVETIQSLFPHYKDYLEVYEVAGLVTDRSVFGHCIHLSEGECSRLAEANAIIAHCPTSNLFLGSGLFNMRQANRYGIQTLIATDVGGGTSFSLLRTLGEAYKVQQLTGYSMPVMESFYKSTLGVAKALQLEDQIGTFRTGSYADFIVVDYAVSPIQTLRQEYLYKTNKDTLENKLFGLQTLGDDRNIYATYVKGKQVYTRECDCFEK